jgi:carboxypeptidase C (cathepsin A)
VTSPGKRLRRPAVRRRQPVLDDMRTTERLVGADHVSGTDRRDLSDDAVRGVPRDSSGWPRYRGNAYAGHVSAGEGTDNFLYYWLASAYDTMPVGETPLIIWLNGGPGASSMAGMLWENGPFTLDGEGLVTPSVYPWNLSAHVLYWDNPVGTGYSYNAHGSKDCYVRDECQMAWQFVNALTGFYAIHPEYADCPLYLAGESYAGKYIPHIALEILYRNLIGVGRPIPLTGLAIGDGWMVPTAQSRDQIYYAALLGILDAVQREKAESVWADLVALMDKGDFAAAKKKDDELMEFIVACGGGENLYDVREFGEMDMAPLSGYLNNEFVKECFNVPPGVSWECSDESGPVSDALVDDIMRPVDDLIPLLVDYPDTAQRIIERHDQLSGNSPSAPSSGSSGRRNGERLKMLFYTGTFDLSCGFSGTEQLLRAMDWSGREEWRSLARKVWFTPGAGGKKTTQGYVKQFQNLTQIEVSGAGHMIPLSRPAANRDMVYRWIQGAAFPSYDPLTGPDVDND